MRVVPLVPLVKARIRSSSAAAHETAIGHLQAPHCRARWRWDVVGAGDAIPSDLCDRPPDILWCDGGTTHSGWPEDDPLTHPNPVAMEGLLGGGNATRLGGAFRADGKQERLDGGF